MNSTPDNVHGQVTSSYDHGQQLSFAMGNACLMAEDATALMLHFLTQQ